MRISISTKLFLGFLFIILLNGIYIVIINKLSDLSIFTDIMLRQESLKNYLLKVNSIQSDKKRSKTSFEAIGKQESVTNFKQSALLLQKIIDSIKYDLNIISNLDSNVFRKNITSSPHFQNHLSLDSVITILANNIDIYDKSFTKMAESGKPLDSLKYLKDENGNILIAVFDSTDKNIASLLSMANSLIDKQNQNALKATEKRITEIKQMTLIILIIISLVSIGFALFFSRILTNSLRRLKESAALIGKGTFSVDSSGYPNDEIGDLANAFSEMASNLKKAQDELIKSKRLAAIGEIVASVNHEINNPLMIISGNAQFLEMSLKDYPEEIKERVRIILEETERISNVTKKLREIKNPVVEEYTSSGEQMINLKKSSDDKST